MRAFIAGVVLCLIVCILAFLVIAYLGLVPTKATSEPPPWETAVMERAFDASIARHAPKVENPVAPDDSALLAGMELYRNDCAGCHGDSNRRSDWGAHGFYPRAPQFAFERPDKPDWQMFWIVKEGIRYTGMGAWGGILPDKKIWQAVTFMSHLDSLPPAVAAQWRETAPKE